MSQDLIADTLNEMLNAKKAGKEKVVVDRHSKLLIKILEIAKKESYVKDFKIDGLKLEIVLGELIDCKAIKPRFYVTKESVEKYRRRYLPARNVGIMIVSTDQGLMTYSELNEKQIGGCLIAYFY